MPQGSGQSGRHESIRDLRCREIPGGVAIGRKLYDVEADELPPRERVFDKVQRLVIAEASRHRRARGGHDRRVETIDIEGHVDMPRKVWRQIYRPSCPVDRSMTTHM